MTIHSLNGSRYVVIEIPERAGDPEINYSATKIVFWDETGSIENELPPGDYEPLIHAKSITEEQAVGMAEWFYLAGKMGYRDHQYSDPRFPFLSGIESIHSWLTSIGHTDDSVILKLK